MKIVDVLSARGLAFVLLFTAVVLVADNFKFSSVWGAPGQYFTLFQFVGPIAGGFLGAGAGMLSVLLAEIVSFFWLGKSVEAYNVLRLAPMLFATLYFARYAKGRWLQAAVPLACMALFIIHPIGSQAWYYSLYWLIPFIALALPEHLFLRALGSTMTAHAVGSVAFLYFLPSTPELWIALIPVVAFERFIFSLGITGSYAAFNTLFSKVDALAKSKYLFIDGRYVIVPERHRKGKE
jgi:hypothetical protein